MIPIERRRFRLQTYCYDGRYPIKDWIKGLDNTVRGRILARISRFEDGNFGDCKPIGQGLVEARFFFGAGYRVYFSIIGDEVILLLNGGDKALQSRDIVRAKEFLKSYLEDSDANKK